MTITEDLTTEQKILRAAENEFLSKGFNGARTTAIAEAAGVTHAMMHYYFRTKDKLFDKVMSEKFSELAHTLLITFDNEISIFESIRLAVYNHFDFVRDNPLLPRFMVSEVFTNPKLLDILKEKIDSIANNTFSALQSKIDQAYKRGECRLISARSIILDIVSLNIFPILALPMISKVTIVNHTDIDTFLQARKEENVETILSKLRP